MYTTEQIDILNVIINRFSTRAVAYLNLADSYMALNMNSEALSNYQKYINLMKKEDKEDKIPNKVFEIVSSLKGE